ncbi:hypothetical protein [Methylocella silvestris]|uniref:Uncharacterized protein n=1 Tax=Methylocella silvestris TaxID=199596 RepID=A0A2J7TF50_METSI|nr:hypothetical protein [Methylocella silvestris]PNG25372.1 hypothetical protein CR492_13655 [Methylocella silvestris]
MSSFQASTAQLYGLLHVADAVGAHANLSAKSGDPIDIYLKCAALCAASVATAGGSFALITNHAARLAARCKALGLDHLQLREYRFVWPVPEGVAFYSAHYKLELIEAFATGAFGVRVGLIDVDTVLQKAFDLPDIAEGALAIYDITDIERASYGTDRIRQDIETVAGKSFPDARWYGGEFIIGDPRAFATLARAVKSCWGNYTQAIGKLHHVGDEAVVSAAINLARLEGFATVNADRGGGVARWWTARTEAPVRRFREIENRSLLHLPSDKEFLAAYPCAGFDGARFVSAYRSYAGRKLRLRRLANFVAGLLGRGKYVARLD